MGGANSQQQARKNKITQRNNDIKQHLRVIQAKLVQLKINQKMCENITNQTAAQLTQKLNKGQLTSQQIVSAYAHRAGTAGLKIRAITQDNFLQALQMAKQCDNIRKTSGKKNWWIGQQWDMNKFLPPLFGIPVSIKDTIDVQGFSSTIGLSDRVNNIKNDGMIIKGMKSAGLIPFVKTNIPQLAMAYQSNNFVWGRSVNPWNQNRASGGSSGGQAALISARGSCLGVGSDLGGSIRNPGQFCGICSLKPGSGRLSYSGHTSYYDSLDGNTIIPAVMGPLARSPDDLFLWMKSVTTKQFYKGNHDPYVSYIKFDDKKYIQAQKNRYKIGYITSLQFCQSTAASQRAVRQAIDVLRDAGHQLIQIKVPNQRDIIQAFISFLAGQGNLQSYRKMLNGQKIAPQYQSLSFLTKLNTSCYCCFACLHGIVGKSQPRVDTVLNGISKKTTHQYLLNTGSIKKYKQQWINYLRTNNIDFVITPGFGCQAFINQYSKQCSVPGCYNYIWNLLDVPAGIVPVTLVKSDEQNYESSHKDDFTEILKKNSWGSQGLPVGVQVIGFPYDEQRVLGIMNVINSKIKFTEKYGKPKV